MDFTYRRKGARDFEETVAAVERLVGRFGFSIVGRQDIRATFAAKGFEIQPLVVLEIGSPNTGMDLCKVHIYAEGEVVWVAAVSPRAFWRTVPRVDGSSGAAVDESMMALVDAACV